MSYVDEDGYMRGTPPSSRVSTRHEKTTVAETSSYTTVQWVLYGSCCFLIVLFLILFFVSASYWWREDNFQHHMNKIVTDLIEQNSLQTDTKNMVSFSALAYNALKKVTGNSLFKANRMGLCYTDMVATKMAPATPTGVIPVLTTVVDQWQSENDMYYYALDFKITLEFDVDTSNYVLNAQHLDQTLRYMTLSYLITSSYTRFSTIKLIESGLDTHTQSLMRTKEVVLCSNNPIFNARPCASIGNGGVSHATSIFIKNTKLVTMSKLVPWVERKNTTTTTTTTTTGTTKPGKTAPPTLANDNAHGNGRELATAEQYDIVQGDNTINNYRSEEDFTRDVRFYNVEFYAAIVPTANKDSRFSAYYTEQIVLTVKPNKCK